MPNIKFFAKIEHITRTCKCLFTTLQKEANTKHGFSADKTLSIAQKLYEAKAITYPRTGSRYIPEDVFAQIPALLLTLKNNPAWSRRLALLGETPTRRSVDDGKVTDHHALLPTDVSFIKD